MGKTLGHHNIRSETLVSLLMFAFSVAAENKNLAKIWLIHIERRASTRRDAASLNSTLIQVFLAVSLRLNSTIYLSQVRRCPAPSEGGKIELARGAT